jgi:hypothetical protein
MPWKGRTQDFDLINADIDNDEFSGFMRLKNLNRVTLDALGDGCILVSVKAEHLKYLDMYLSKKSNEMWLNLCQMEGDNFL